MTRKQYTKKIWTLAFAIRQKSMRPGTKWPMDYKAMKDHAKNVAKEHGSYENAWNSDCMKWARAYYLGEEL